MQLLPSKTEMERAFFESNPGYTGIFWVGVRTTGIFCRPNCPARKPRPDHVEYFGSVREAMFAGFRPCLRCHPLETVGRPPEWIRPLIDRVQSESASRFRSQDIAAMGIEPKRARRWFQANYGMSFVEYCRARRLHRAFHQLKNGEVLDEVALGNGYDSHSGFRDAFQRYFGKPPGKSRESNCIALGWMESPLGPLIAGATSDGICLVEFSDRRMLESQIDAIQRRFRLAVAPGDHPHLEALRLELGNYFCGKLKSFSVPWVAPGTDFQEKVWAELTKIPYGETCSYGQLAARLGVAGGQRAVGLANGKNRICILIPCHRVVNHDGSLGGYGGGLWRKRWLLDLEQSNK
jgi:AraC family transcriptional regulator of adaptative response/methylated-DNA-[protein]-cysteine methyltransferase